MIAFSKPTQSQLRDFLWQCQDEPFTYDEVGGTKGAVPRGYSCGQRRVHLGTGRFCYSQAKTSLRQWKMFPSEFTDLIWPVALEEGRVVATLFRAPGFWTVNPCRIVYTVDDIRSDAEGVETERFGFAYGTVGSHLASGEERFLIEYDHANESVWYEIYCFSKVNHWLSVAAYPYLRWQQHRFRKLSTEAMKRAACESVA